MDNYVVITTLTARCIGLSAAIGAQNVVAGAATSG